MSTAAGRPRLRTGIGALAVVLPVALAAACGSGEPDDDDSTTGTADSTSTAAEAERYEPAELGQALPRGRVQLHRHRVESQCRDLTKPCDDATSAGRGMVSTMSGDEFGFTVEVQDEVDQSTWRENLQTHCPEGKIRKQIERHDGDSFTPGEKGTGAREPLAIGTWEGYQCTRDVTYLFPDGYPSQDLDEPVTVLLSNGFHQLRVQGRSPDLVENLAREYVERLEDSA